MPARPPVSRIIVATLFAISGVNQLVQVPGEFLGDGALPTLGALHIAAGVPGLATAWGCWFATRWAWVAALCWGAATATLILSLEHLLRLPANESQGFLPAALIVAALALLAAWYLRRVGTRSGDGRIAIV